MTLIRNACVAVKWLPSVQPVRFSRRPNIQRPREPHYERARVIDVCRPVFPRKTEVAPMFELCQKPAESLKSNTISLENPYFRFLARDFMNNMKHSKMVAFVHLNSMTAEEKFKVGVQLKKQNMYVKAYNRNIVRLAVENTRYEAILPLFESQSAIVFSPEVQVKKLLKILRRAPNYVLLAGIVDGQQLSKPELVRYSQLPDLAAARAGLVSAVNALGAGLLGSLCAHQQALVRHLDQHAEMQGRPPAEETPTSHASGVPE
ncbi:large ribosomal subunit protein uL10m [Bacillus rossius redtenbacheri]|uniref:large ribosomal subunit protein uL10m n=1 Tax=Bacillus rossius redtenbacheri TaxID=93214 RepID=UPI002FDD3231